MGLETPDGRHFWASWVATSTLSAMRMAGVACCGGLFDDLESYSAELERTGMSIEVLQVKYEMGQLRVAIRHTNEAIEAGIETARQRRGQACEL